MKKVGFCLLVAIFITSMLVSISAADKVLIYAALDEKTANELAAAFTEETGIEAEVALQIEQAGTVSGRIKIEVSNPRADVFIGGNSNYHTDLAVGGFLEKYTSPVVKKPGFQSSLLIRMAIGAAGILGDCACSTTRNVTKKRLLLKESSRLQPGMICSILLTKARLLPPILPPPAALI